MLTADALHKCFPKANKDNLNKYADALIAACEEFEINTPKRVAGFLSQVAHESAQFSAIKENLNYKASALTALFGSRITAAQAAEVGRDDATKKAANQEGIANIIYGGAWGAKNLGNVNEGDGWAFRGRGLIQLTGRSNYTRCGQGLGKDLATDPSYLETPEGAVRSAAWFWKSRGLNEVADTGDVRKMTKLVNGGDLGLADREHHYHEILGVLGDH